MATSTAEHVRTQPPTHQGQRRRPPRFRRDRALLVMVAPGLLLLLAFQYYPLLGNVIAFQDYVPFIGIRDSPFVGLSNFSSFSPTPPSGTPSATRSSSPR